MKELCHFLAKEYGIQAKGAFPAQGGFSTKAAYRVVGADNTEYFVKVYDSSLPTTRFFVERIDLYMPVLHWLCATLALRGRVLTPVAAKTGRYRAESGSDVYAVFLYVSGQAPGLGGMTPAQTAELGEILADLHRAGAALPFDAPGLAEDLSLPFCHSLRGYLDRQGGEDSALYALVSPHAPLLGSAIAQLLKIRDKERVGCSSIVLCHGDAHGGNVLQSDRLILADWEDLRWAPPEADLFISAWHPHGDILLKAYTAKMGGFCLNPRLLYFYTLRRRIEDVWVDIQRLTEEACSQAERDKLLNWTQQGIAAVQALYRPLT